MNGFLLLLCLSFFAALAHAQHSKSFTLEGKFPAGSAGTVYISYAGKYDSTVIKGGRFSFKGKIDHPALAYIFYREKSRELFLDPAAMIYNVPDPDFTKGKLNGSRTNSELEKYNAGMQKIKDRWKIVMDTLSAVNRRSNVAFQELKGWVLVPYFEEIKEANIAFFTRYPSSYVSAYHLKIAGRELATDSLKMFYDRFSTAVKQSQYGKDIWQMLENRKVGIPGTMAAVFTTPDINQRELNLADLRGKYVLLDFWGSWCVPCRKGHPRMRELYAKYKDKGVEFIGIADDDDTQDAWRKAVKDDQLDWLQVLKGKDPSSKLTVKYNVNEFPTRILIDKEGKIIGRYAEELTELEKLFGEIFR
jgi:thiol-disulfide isomerase/thioredoxin